MAVSGGAFQRAVLVAVPLSLVVGIIITPAFTGREVPQPTDIPFLLVRVIGQPWNGSVNDTAMLYVRSALGVPLYEYIEIGAYGVGGDPNATAVATGTYVPSLVLKIPAGDGWVANVTALAVQDASTYRYNATVAFVWGEPEWTLRVQAEGASQPRDVQGTFTAAMVREASP